MSKKPTVLVLDDEEIICLNLASFLEEEGYQVIAAHSGEDGLELMNRVPVDIAVVDVRLPGIDGNTFMRKAHQKNPNIHFLIHTGSSQYVLPADLMGIGIKEEDILLKPLLDMNVLSDAIKRVAGSELYH